LVSQDQLDGLYGQRWKVEIVYSVIKRIFGNTIRSRSLALQTREPIVKALIYNLQRGLFSVIRRMFATEQNITTNDQASISWQLDSYDVLAVRKQFIDLITENSYIESIRWVLSKEKVCLIFT
jgi:hypothetical protein